MSHLTETRYRQLLAGDLPPEEARALARHLEGPCDECEAFLVDRQQADRLDGRVEAALTGLSAGRAAAGNDLEFQRILRRVVAGDGAEAQTRPRVRRSRLLALAAVVALAGVAGLVLGIQRAPPAWDGAKGMGRQAAPVRLRFLVLSPGPAGAPALEKGISGQAVEAAASLSFEIELGRPAEVALVRVPARGAPELFFRRKLGAGRTAVSVDGRPAAYPLGELAGPQRFVAVAGAPPLDPGRALAAAAAAGPAARGGAEPEGPEGISTDSVEVIVR
ncbi:MAG TPA: hypothetical protein VML50_04305 [Anaeromyxobacter sp.]|nr:hypothetical protein [Anaeromyxobacter sp.]